MRPKSFKELDFKPHSYGPEFGEVAQFELDEFRSVSVLKAPDPERYELAVFDKRSPSPIYLIENCSPELITGIFESDDLEKAIKTAEARDLSTT